MGSLIRRNKCDILMELIIIDDDINIIFEENYKVLFALIYINKT